MHIDESVWAHVWKCLSRVFPPLTDRLVDSDYILQTDGQTSCTFACTCTCTDGQTQISQRLFKNAGCACTSRVRECVRMFVSEFCVGEVGRHWRGLINCTDVDFLSQSPVSFNNLCIQYPPLAPPKPITDKPRRGAPSPCGKMCMCGLTPPTLAHLAY